MESGLVSPQTMSRGAPSLKGPAHNFDLQMQLKNILCDTSLAHARAIPIARSPSPLEEAR